jgi:mono/diheme cytochrome c family protein
VKNLMRYATVLLILVMAACGGSDAPPPAEDHATEAAAPAAAEVAQDPNLPDGGTAAMVTEGEAIFIGAGICFTCHMQGGVGGPLAPNLTDDVWLNIDGSYESIVRNVTTGVLEPKEHPSPMLPRGGTNITDAQVAAVSAYVWTLSNG